MNLSCCMKHFLSSSHNLFSYSVSRYCRNLELFHRHSPPPVIVSVFYYTRLRDGKKSP
ncbi:hypothetical protein PT2222_120152 [Paraburkholderia tropica]